MRNYHLDRCLLQISAPVEVGSAAGHHWFATLHPVSESDILCEVITTADKAQGKWPAWLYLSRDAGQSWQKACEIESFGPSSVSLGPREILLMPYELWPLSQGDRRNAVADGTVIHCAHDGTIAAHAAPACTTPYTCMKATGRDEVLISYDRLGNGWEGAPGPWGPHDVVFTVRVHVS